MKEGQFWDIPLSNGKYACGRVLQLDYSAGKRHSRSFLAGLIDWVGEDLPTSDVIAGAKLLEQGTAHIRTIAFVGGEIRGSRPLDQDGITPFFELSHMPGIDCRLMQGFVTLRLATLEEQMSLYIQSSWGLGVIKLRAEDYFVKQKPPVKRLPWDKFLELRAKFFADHSR